MVTQIRQPARWVILINDSDIPGTTITGTAEAALITIVCSSWDALPGAKQRAEQYLQGHTMPAGSTVNII